MPHDGVGKTVCQDNSEWTKNILRCTRPGCEEWTEWENWSECDCPTGTTGVQSRTRTCLDGCENENLCSNSEEDTQNCGCSGNEINLLSPYRKENIENKLGWKYQTQDLR